MADPLVPRRIVLHCSDTEDGPGNNWQAIRKYHTDPKPGGRGFVEIGYHFGIEQIGGRLALLAGRHPYVMGAHCAAAGRNHDSLGICVVGDFDDDPPPLRLVGVVTSVLALLCVMHGIAPETISGHREWEPGKTCPGAKWDMEFTRAMVGERLGRLRHSGVTDSHLAIDWLRCM
jgi:hypothetical protein